MFSAMGSRRSRRAELIIKLGAVALFAVGCALIWWYELSVSRPKAICLQRPGAVWSAKDHKCRVTAQAACESNGGWWDAMDGICAKVVSIPSITGRR